MKKLLKRFLKRKNTDNTTLPRDYDSQTYGVDTINGIVMSNVTIIAGTLRIDDATIYCGIKP